MANLAELTRVQTHTLAMTRTVLDAAASLGVLDGSGLPRAAATAP
jgi:hypothetical protein